MYPMKLEPAYKDYLWGGTRLKDEFDKKTVSSPVAESWEVSCHPDGLSVIANGMFKGKSLWNVLSGNPDMIGSKYADTSQFPILIKLIDAKDKLSLQVHPDDGYALRVENQFGKNEMWYVVDCEPGAEIILGFKYEAAKDEIHRAIEDGTLEDMLNHIPVKPGDCFCIQAGMLHAIGTGILIAEVQQSSNLTYRVYDYGRRDAGGSLRELHINKALEVTEPSLKVLKSRYGAVATPGYKMEPLCRWEYFDSRRYSIHGSFDMVAGGDSFHTWLCLEGEAAVLHGREAYPIAKGESVFIPAGMGKYAIEGMAVALYTGMAANHKQNAVNPCMD